MESNARKYTAVAKIPYYGELSINSFTKKLERAAEEQKNSTTTVGESFQKNNVFAEVRHQEQKQAISHSLLTEEWEGCIEEVRETIFIARLYKKNSQHGEIIEGEFEINDVPQYERNLIREGVVFYWNIGKETKKSGTISNGDHLIFRRMPSWKKFDINKPSTTTEEFIRAFKQDH